MRICMVTYSYYESDNRVIRYAESLVQRGDTVEVLALRRSPETAKEEVVCGVKVFRIQDRLGKREQSGSSFLWPLFRFLAVSSWWVMRRHQRQRYDLLHLHNLPDFIVFAGWYPKLTGAKLILDIHDIVPEFFASKFALSSDSTLVQWLKLVEKASAAFADYVILSNHLWLEKFIARSAEKEKCSVVINHVDAAIFRTRPTYGRGNLKNPVVLFPGGLQWHQGLDIAIRAFANFRSRIPEAEFHIYGDGIMKAQLVELVNRLDLQNSVRFFEPVSLREIAAVMAKADLGIVPKRADSFGNEAYSTKIMEFMSVGVPLVVAGTKVDRYYFNDSVVRFFEPGNVNALSEAMYAVLSDFDSRCGMIHRASEYAVRNSWASRKAEYLTLVDALCERNTLRDRLVLRSPAGASLTPPRAVAAASSRQSSISTAMTNER
ncbi:MAG: glycosyltransferase family 4 protein [Verrucomicrobia bacterium]|nr:glycosyltransferase family 4 protein [Verrucomicrobiota bacterium]